MRYAAVIISLFLTVSQAMGHPVSFEGGVAIMSELSEGQRELSVVYSPKWWLGTGALIEKIEQDRLYSSLHLGFLAKRWNLPEAQGNLYFLGGPGGYKFDESGASGSFVRFGMQADYETRRIYTAVRYVERRSLEESFNLLDDSFELGLGVAPYVAGFTELNSWVIMRVRATNRFEDISYIPTLRFFYKNFLWELGQSLKGKTQFNFMIRY